MEPCGEAAPRYLPYKQGKNGRLATAVMETCGGRCAVFSGSDGAGYHYALGQPDADLRPLVRQLNEALQGRGGGKPFFAQGSVRASQAQIEAFFAALP